MDTEVVRTFLEIVNSGNFIRAERLNVGQTTVSARIHLLEEQLGRPLFVRNKAGATLTPEGVLFLHYAPSFVQLWERARQKIAVPPGHRAMLHSAASSACGILGYSGGCFGCGGPSRTSRCARRSVCPRA